MKNTNGSVGLLLTPLTPSSVGAVILRSLQQKTPYL